MLRAAWRALRLGYLTGRAVIHTILVRDEIGNYCRACNSLMRRNPDGSVFVIAQNRGDRVCPVHIAWRELALEGRP